MHKPSIVLDTNILISALRSKYGAAFKLLSLVGESHFDTNLSVPLMLEYEAVAMREIKNLPHTAEEIDDILDYMARASQRWEIFFLWRPCLSDPKDDMVLEIAVQSGSQYIVTYNARDFIGIDKFGITAITPKGFLQQYGLIP